MSNKNKKNNYNHSERYLREEESAGKNVGNNVQTTNTENFYTTKKCWNKNCKCNGGQTKSCK